jgi:hypothetical protein
MRLYVLRASALAASVVSTAATVVGVATWPGSGAGTDLQGLGF